jgi:hypothetical protein
MIEKVTEYELAGGYLRVTKYVITPGRDDIVIRRRHFAVDESRMFLMLLRRDPDMWYRLDENGKMRAILQVRKEVQPKDVFGFAIKDLERRGSMKVLAECISSLIKVQIAALKALSRVEDGNPPTQEDWEDVLTVLYLHAHFYLD